MQLELVSFALCPFAQRAVILLKRQALHYKITFINPMDPPEWFKKISPTGQVPLLRVDDEIVFESVAINEFINDISGGELLPENPLKKAQNRAWIQFSSAMMQDLFHIATGDKTQFTQSKDALFAALSKFETAKTTAPFFNGGDFSLVDATMAPLFMRLKWINEFTDNALSLAKLPQISQWSDALLSLNCVQKSAIDGLSDVYCSMIEARSGHLASLIIE